MRVIALLLAMGLAGCAPKPEPTAPSATRTTGAEMGGPNAPHPNTTPPKTPGSFGNKGYDTGTYGPGGPGGVMPPTPPGMPGSKSAETDTR